MSDHPWESWVAAAREINEIRDALVAALGGPDSVPPGATPLDMIAALSQLNCFYHNRWGESHAKLQQAKRTLRAHGIDTHTSKPLDQDLLGATWSAAPLSPEEIARAEAVGIDVGPLDSRLPAKWALIRQETARREAIAWVGDPHRHPGQFGARMCHDHDDFGYHCHDLAARPGAEPGRMYR